MRKKSWGIVDVYLSKITKSKKRNIVLPVLITLLISTLSLIITVINTEGILPNQPLSIQEKYTTFFIGFITICLILCVSKLILTSYLFVVFKTYNYYLEFKIILSIVLSLAVIGSLGEFINIVSKFYFSKEYLTYLTTYINNQGFWFNALLRPLEFFNIVSLILLLLIFIRLTKLPIYLMIFTIIPILVYQMMEGTFSYLIEFLFT